MIYFFVAVLAILVIVLIVQLNSNVELFHEQLRKKDEEIKKLNEEKDKLEEELSNYTQIQNDSLNLNVIDEEEPEEELTEENEIITGESSDLNKEKIEIFDIMENTNSNLFITGKAGTGKSYLLKYFRNHTTKKVLYCAPTGIAALSIGAVTIHSAFGWNNLNESQIIKISLNKELLFKSIDAVVIDEISMVRVDVFNQIDKILKIANKNSLPFGGKQIILFGDLFQLPPVAKKEEVEYLNDKYGGVFFFNSPAYDNGNFKFRELQEIFRQKDSEFIEILNDLRVGIIKEQHIQSLNRHYVKDVPRRVVQIVPKKDEANDINMNSLGKLGSPLFEYPAKILSGEENIKPTDFPCDFDLKLKVGALVMMITNDPEYKRWVNGTLGIVSYLSNEVVKVTINGTDYEISPVTFNTYKCEYDKEKKKLEYLVDSSVNQYPLRLAYALTIHKSQGMTYQQIACNLKECFAPGQAYVALSRCANYDTLYLTKKITADSIIVDKTIINFYNDVRNK